jgi:hypothetical protein
MELDRPMLHNLRRSTTLAAGAVIILTGLLGPSARAAADFPDLGSPTVVVLAQSPGACSAALDELGQTWNRLGFNEPSKPAQMRVLGSSGRTISGQDYGYITSQIRWAAVDCRNGSDAEALARIHRVKIVLDRSVVGTRE